MHHMLHLVCLVLFLLEFNSFSQTTTEEFIAQTQHKKQLLTDEVVPEDFQDRTNITFTFKTNVTQLY